MAESLTLKWGTLKGWNDLSEKSQAIVEKYWALGAQPDTPEQKQLILDLIDTVDGEIWNDWDGVAMSKDEAKKYVTEYGQRK